MKIVSADPLTRCLWAGASLLVYTISMTIYSLRGPVRMRWDLHKMTHTTWDQLCTGYHLFGLWFTFFATIVSMDFDWYGVYETHHMVSNRWGGMTHGFVMMNIILTFVIWQSILTRSPTNALFFYRNCFLIVGSCYLFHSGYMLGTRIYNSIGWPLFFDCVIQIALGLGRRPLIFAVADKAIVDRLEPILEEVGDEEMRESTRPGKPIMINLINAEDDDPNYPENYEL